VGIDAAICVTRKPDNVSARANGFLFPTLKIVHDRKAKEDYKAVI
jgi:hypothetical protein